MSADDKLERKSWRCFHCDDVFDNAYDARLHFGREEGATPACQIKGSEHGLVEALRKAENEASDAWLAIHNETTDAANACHSQQARHSQQLRSLEQVGYDRGLADARAHPETIGLVPASALEALRAQNAAQEAEIATLRESSTALTGLIEEIMIRIENDTTLWTPEWQIWLVDARAALRQEDKP